MSDDTTHLRDSLAALQLKSEVDDGVIEALESRLRQAERDIAAHEARWEEAKVTVTELTAVTERLRSLVSDIADELGFGGPTVYPDHVAVDAIRALKGERDALAARLVPPDDGALRELCEAWETYTSHGAWTTEANVALMTFLLACRRLNLPALVARAREPDIRPAEELTPERLAAWDGYWMIEALYHGDDTPGMCHWHIIHSSRVSQALEMFDYVLGAFPIHGGEPWRPATWPEVDVRVKGGRDE